MQIWLTVSEASPILKMSTQAIYSAIREHQVPPEAILRIGRRIRINVAALNNSACDDQSPRERSQGRSETKREN
jgi:hypothetical protein